MNIDAQDIRQQLHDLEVRPRDLDAAVEAEHLANLIAGELFEALSGYSSPRMEGVGGSGIVMSAIHDEFGVRRAIKVPRKRVLEEASAGEPTADVAPELHALSRVSHKNITRLYQAHPLFGGAVHCVITEYVEHPAALDQFALELCCSKLARENETVRVRAVRQLAGIVYDVVDALLYLHDTTRIIHFDIKPDNILVSASGKPFVTDLGFAREMGKYALGTLVEVGFTWKYAHPGLTDPERVKSRVVCKSI